jgi:hypothetical protein
VERADDAVVGDRAADGDIGPEMWAVGIEHVRISRAAAVTDELSTEVVQADDLS